MAEGLVEWAASGLTVCAAIVTASNLGARITGYGFAIFTAASALWAFSGLQGDQSSLLLTNGFLVLVNAFGIWRWLGRERMFEVGGKEAEKDSEREPTPSIVPTVQLMGREVLDAAGDQLGKIGEVLIERDSGAISYVVVTTGHVPGPTLRAVAWSDIDISEDAVTLALTQTQFNALTVLEEGNWPTNAPDSVAN